MERFTSGLRKIAEILFGRRRWYGACLALGLGLSAFLPVASAAEPVLSYRLYNEGETFSYRTSLTPNHTASEAETAAIERAFSYVNEVFADSSPLRTSTIGVYYLVDGAKSSSGAPSNNAFSTSRYVRMSGDRYWRSETEILTVLRQSINPSNGLDGTICLEPTSTTTWATLSNSSLPSGNWSTESIIVHELGHTLGMRTYYGYADGEHTLYQWLTPTYFQSMVVDAGGNPVQNGDTFVASTPYYFSGTHATDLYGENVPLTTISVQKSHLGLDPLLMTHESFRNYTFYTELELAIFQDLGYTIDRSRFFGKSYYVAAGTADSPEENAVGFDSSATYGVGLHVYSDGNYLIQTADLNASGAGGCAVRIDGEGNVVTVADGVSVSASGENGIGVLVSNGSGNVVNLLGDVTADDPNGCGVYLGYGHSLLSRERSSSLDDPLVDALNVSGSIQSGGNAIYVGANIVTVGGVEQIYAAVTDEINLMSGADISGDIVADGVLYRLTFGRKTDASGAATDEADAAFSFDYDGDLLTNLFLGESGLIGTELSAVGGETTLTGSVTARTLTVDAGATLNVNHGNIGVDRGEVDGTLVCSTGMTVNGLLTGDRLINEFSDYATGIDGVGTLRFTGGTTNDGILSPGDGDGEIGVLTFEGALTNTSSAVLTIDLSASDNPLAGRDVDAIAVNESAADRGDGTATLDGSTVLVSAAQGRYRAGTLYRFLQTSDGLTTANTPTVIATGTVPLFHFAFGSDDDSAYLAAERDYHYAPAADTPNQRAVGGWFDLVGTNPAPGSDLYDVLVTLDGMSAGGTVSDRALEALDQMSGAIYGSLAAAQIERVSAVNGTLSNLLRDGVMNGCGDAAVCGAASRMTKKKLCRHYWGTALGGGGDIRSDGNAPGVSDSFYGTVFGFDRFDSTDTRAGFFGSYAGSTLRGKTLSERIEADELMFGCYFRQGMNVGYLLGTAGLGWNVCDAERNLPLFQRRAESSFDALTTLVSLERGVEYTYHGVKLQPFAGLQYAGIYRERFTETGAGALNLSSGSAAADSLRTNLGLRSTVEKIRPNGDRLRFSLRGSWMSELLDANTAFTARLSDPEGTNPLAAATFTVNGERLGRDWFFLGTGLNYERDALRLFAGYDLGLNDARTFHLGSVGLSLRR